MRLRRKNRDVVIDEDLRSLLLFRFYHTEGRSRGKNYKNALVRYMVLQREREEKRENRKKAMYRHYNEFDIMPTNYIELVCPEDGEKKKQYNNIVYKRNRRRR